jgi:hypothetical protein
MRDKDLYMAVLDLLGFGVFVRGDRGAESFSEMIIVV